MATLRTELSSFYKKLIDAENNTLGFLGNPEEVLNNYESFLAEVDLSLSGTLLTQRVPKNGSYIEGFVSIPIFTIVAIQRDLGMRNLTRKDYYRLGGSEIQDEVSRLETAKISVIQSIAGNLPVSSRGQ